MKRKNTTGAPHAKAFETLDPFAAGDAFTRQARISVCAAVAYTRHRHHCEK